MSANPPAGDAVTESKSLVSSEASAQLVEVLKIEFPGAVVLPEGEEEEEEEEEEQKEETEQEEQDAAKGAKVVDQSAPTSTWWTRWQWLRKFLYEVIENQLVVAFFMVLTIYALFAPDIDLCVGTKDSKKTVGIITTIVFWAFTAEMLAGCIAKEFYLFRINFWLDLVSLLSLLPDTSMVDSVLNSSAFVAGRSTRLLRIIRVAVRSSKVARLSKLTRVIRAANLLPRIQKLLGRGVGDKDTERILRKKLLRIFNVLDEDMDGFVTQDDVDDCILRIRQIVKVPAGVVWAKGSGPPASIAGTAPTTPSASGKLAGSGDLSQARVATDADTAAPPDLSEEAAGPRKPQVDYDGFFVCVCKDANVGGALWRSCKKQLHGGHSVQQMAAKTAEQIGVKVALSVLLILLVLSLLAAPSMEDQSKEFALAALDQFVNATQTPAVGAAIPLSVQSQVMLMADDVGNPDFRPTLLYLDVEKWIFCNSVLTGKQACNGFPRNLTWERRRSLDDISDWMEAYNIRANDVVQVSYPDLSTADLSAEEIDRQTLAVAVFNGRLVQEKGARTSLITTAVVIVIILSGIGLLTKDLTFVQQSLLKPLVELGDDVDGITRLQLAAAGGEEKVTAIGEIQKMRVSFDSLKNAIRSWGKYVPWPVIQLMLRQDSQDNSFEPTEREVSMFFSDIAGFTTIVESLKPERSLMLLSRYLHEMSKIIDKHGGIVIEFIGDAISSVHGAPVRNPEHPLACVKAAVEMLDAITAMEPWLKENNLPYFRIRCGVHTGKVVVGNMGIESRMKYGIVGEESGVPGHLEETNKNYKTEMLISEATYKRIKPDAFLIRPIDYQVLVEEPGGSGVSTPLYNVLGRDTKAPKLAEIREAFAEHTAAMKAYREMDFQGALDKFRLVNQRLLKATGKEDEPSALMMRRCDEYLAHPPPANWNGVYAGGGKH